MSCFNKADTAGPGNGGHKPSVLYGLYLGCQSRCQMWQERNHDGLNDGIILKSEVLSVKKTLMPYLLVTGQGFKGKLLARMSDIYGIFRN